MPILVACACGKKYSTPDAAAGKKMKCKQCGTLLPIPGAAAQTPPPDEYGLAELPEEKPSAARAAEKAAALMTASAAPPPAPATIKPARAMPPKLAPLQPTAAPAPSKSLVEEEQDYALAGPLPPALMGAASYEAAQPARPKRRRKTASPDSKAKEESKDVSGPALLFAVVFVLAGFMCYHEFDGLERNGGSIRMHVVFIALYKTVGKEGVLILCLLGGAICVVVSIWSFIESKIR